MANVKRTDDEVRKNIQERRILNEHRRRAEIYSKNDQLKRIEIESFNMLIKEARSSLDSGNVSTSSLDIKGSCGPELFVGDDSDEENTSVDCQFVEGSLDESKRHRNRLLRKNDVEFCQEFLPNVKKSVSNFGERIGNSSLERLTSWRSPEAIKTLDRRLAVFNDAVNSFSISGMHSYVVTALVNARFMFWSLHH